MNFQTPKQVPFRNDSGFLSGIPLQKDNNCYAGAAATQCGTKPI